MLTGNDPLKKRPLPPDKRTSRGGSFARAAGAYVPKIASKAFEKFGFHTAEIMMQWPVIAGKEIATWTRPERIRWPRLPNGSDASSEGPNRPGGTLVLRVEPARALDIEYRSAEIMDRVNRYFGYRAVETLKIIQAPLTSSKASAAASPAPAKELTTPPPGAEELPQTLAAMPDDGLKAALANLWTSVTRQK